MTVENNVLIDWLSVTSKTFDVTDFMILLGLHELPWQETKGAQGYKRRMYYESISIHFDGNDSVWLEMSGQGCRAFETYGNGNYHLIFNLCEKFPKAFNLTRLDIAYDDLVRPEYSGEKCIGILDINKIANDTRLQNYISKSIEWIVTESSKGCSVGIGSMKSKVYIRIYDKAAERGYEDGTHWVRVELQLRDDRAYQFSRLDGGIGKSFAGVLLNYLRYLSPDKKDTNKSRWKTARYWDKLVKDAERISIYVKPGVNYNMLQCENYVFNMAGNAINAVIDVYGEERFYEKLKERKIKPNPKYQTLVDSVKRESEAHRDIVEDEAFQRAKETLDIIGPNHVRIPFYDKVSNKNYEIRKEKEK